MTLEELEQHVWPEPECGTYLISQCHRLRRKPMEDFTIEDFRILIGQKIGARHLISRALDILEVKPLAAGDFYPGDLLCSVLSSKEIWANSADVLGRLVAIVEKAMQHIDRDEIELRDELARFLDDAMR